MKNFFKYFFAALLAIIVAIFLIIVIPLGIAAMSGSGEPVVKNKSVLKLNFNRTIPEKTDNVEQGFSFSSGQDNIGMHRIRNIIEAAADDSKIKAIVIQNAGNSLSYADSREMIESIKKFKESGKPIYAYSDYMSQKAYYISSVADSIFLNPNGAIEMKGFGTGLMFFKGAMEKYGLDVNIFYAGKFKSATEPFREKKMTNANKLQVKEYLNGILDVYQEDIAQARGITKEKVDYIMDGLESRNAKLALENKLIDGILFRDQFNEKLIAAIGVDEDEKINYVSLDQYNKVAKNKKKGDRKNQIAVVFAEGTVNYGSKKKGEINESVYLKALNDIKDNDKIKAVVLRVNSGGGSSLTSDIIWRAVEEIKDTGKPVIASFGGVAASGGYYIACGADTIVANPNTITGSIGVFSMIPSMQRFFNKNFQVTFDSVKTNQHALALSGIYPIKGKEAQFMQESVDQIYDQFLSRVAEGRGMTVDAVNEVAQGRVWVGTKAKEIGLVDVIGGLDDAIAIAAEKIDVENPRLRYYPSIEQDPFMQILKSFPKAEMAMKNYMPDMDPNEVKLYKKMKELQTLANTQDPQARIPYDIDFD